MTRVARLGLRVATVLLGLLAVLLVLGGILPALWQFAAFHPRVAALYDAALGVGWGLIVCVIGFVLLLVRGVLAAFIPSLFGTDPR